MRRARHLMAQLTSFEALWLASRRARRGKRRSPGAAAFEHHLEANLLQVQASLRDGSFRWLGYRTFEVRDPVPRTIRAAPFRDRVVHHALCAQLEPLLERRMIEDSFACRVGKGTHRAVARLERFLRAGGWVVKVDVRKYFFAIDHALLRAQLRQVVADPAVLQLLDTLLDTYDATPEVPYPLPGDHRVATAPGTEGAIDAAGRPRGLPIGNLTSQLLANAFLTPVDRFIKEQLRVRRYVRYMDDLVLVAPDRATAQAWLAAVAGQLAALRLLPHPRKTQLFPATNGVRFLGFRVYPDGRRIRRDNLQRLVRRMRRQMVAVQRGHLPPDRVLASLRSWLGFADPVRHRTLLNAVLAPLRFHPPGATLPFTYWIPEHPPG
jgi:RNA-directed DNA polymerase